MNATDFWALVLNLEREAQDLSTLKSADYATDDVLSNFKRMSMLWSGYLRVPVSPADVAVLMLLMKLDRIKNLEGRDPQNESVRDTTMDAINYLRLAVGCMHDAPTSCGSVIHPPRPPSGVRPLIYIAGPLSAYHRDGRPAHGQIAINRNVAVAWGDYCFLKGWAIYVPHSMTEHWFDLEDPAFSDYDLVVRGQDFALLHRCQAILFCPGWGESKGALMERTEAMRIGLPMYEHHADVPDLREEAD